MLKPSDEYGGSGVTLGWESTEAAWDASIEKAMTAINEQLPPEYRHGRPYPLLVVIHGGPDASWIIRWTQVRPGRTGNGDIYYAGLDNNAGGSGSPSFFAGDTTPVPPANSANPALFMTFPQTKALTRKQASYSAKTGVITMRIPLSAAGKPA